MEEMNRVKALAENAMEQGIIQQISGRTLAIDGDIVAYRTAAVCEEHFEGACDAIIDTTLREMSTNTGLHYARIYLSGEDNFRYKVAKTKPYKGNRATMVRPKYLDHCKQYLFDKYGAIRMDGYEADDGIATDMNLNGAVHCGIDKDMLQCAGWHYNYVKNEFKFVSDEEAITTLYRQILMGDNSDNIPGLPRIGEKTAATMIEDAETAEDDAIDAYNEICAKSLPGVNYIEYFAEQRKLVQMVNNIDLYDIAFNNLTFIEPGLVDGGFNAQGESEEKQTIIQPKLNIRL